MVWSLSKDDDGLESVYPLNQGAALSQPSESLSLPAKQQLKHPMNAAPSPTKAAPSVFVEPSSQLPEAPAPFHPREVVEPTMVLKGRKLDEMRAAVARQKSGYRREKQKTLLLWALSGGAALAMGWFFGILLSPEHTSKIPSNGALSAGSGAVVDPSHTETGSAESEPRVAPAPTNAVRLEDLPSEDVSPHPGSSDPEQQSEEVPPAADATDTSLPSGTDAFTLDDLPAE